MEGITFGAIVSFLSIAASIIAFIALLPKAKDGFKILSNHEKINKRIDDIEKRIENHEGRISTIETKNTKSIERLEKSQEHLIEISKMLIKSQRLILSSNSDDPSVSLVLKEMDEFLIDNIKR